MDWFQLRFQRYVGGWALWLPLALFLNAHNEWEPGYFRARRYVLCFKSRVIWEWLRE